MMIQTETKWLAFNLFVLGILENNGVALKAKRIWILEVSCVSFKHIVQCFDQKALENSRFFFVSFLLLLKANKISTEEAFHSVRRVRA